MGSNDGNFIASRCMCKYVNKRRVELLENKVAIEEEKSVIKRPLAVL